MHLFIQYHTIQCKIIIVIIVTSTKLIANIVVTRQVNFTMQLITPGFIQHIIPIITRIIFYIFIFMCFSRHIHVSVTPDLSIETYHAIQDSRTFKFLEFSFIFYRKSNSNENQGISNGKSSYFHEIIIKHFLVSPTLLPEGSIEVQP